MISFYPFLMLFLGFFEMGFGIYIFYILLPLWYALFGGYLGIGIGQAIFNGSNWAGNIFIWILAIILALVFGIASYALEPYRRYLAGGLIGATLALLLAATFGLGGFFGAILAILFAFVFAVLIKSSFDLLIIIGSAIVGSALVLDGGFLLTSWDWLNRLSGNFIPLALWIGLSAVGVAWQLGPIKQMYKAQSELQAYNEPVKKVHAI